MIEFEWDVEKAVSNYEKHGVVFEDALEIFQNPVIDKPDTRRNYGEERWIVTGIFEGAELLSKVGDGGFQAARSISFSPSLNLTPSTISARR